MSAFGGPLRRGLSLQADAGAAMRRARFVARVKTLAWHVGATVELDLAPDVMVGRHLAVTIDPGSHSVVRLGAGSSLGDRVTVMLKGGS